MSKRGKQQNRQRKAMRAANATSARSAPAVRPPAGTAPVRRLVRLMQAQLDEDRKRKQTKAQEWLFSLGLGAKASRQVLVMGQSYSAEDVREALRIVREQPSPAPRAVISGDQLIDLYTQAIKDAGDEHERSELRAALLLERARCQVVARENRGSTVRISADGVRAKASEVITAVERHWTRLDMPPRPAAGIVSPLQATLEAGERRAMIRAMLAKVDDTSRPLLSEAEDYFFANLEDIHLDRFARCVATVMEVPPLTWAPTVFQGHPVFADSLVRAEREAWPEGP